MKSLFVKEGHTFFLARNGLRLIPTLGGIDLE
jgi:hypothetical protein